MKKEKNYFGWFVGIMLIAFLALLSLKCCKIINCGWLVVTMPLVAIVFFVLFILYVGMKVVSYQQENLKPIMITKEILKANGFEEDPEDGTMCWRNKELEEVTWRGTILKIDSLSASLELVSCMYLHQLQHALKLCGIGIEISL